MELTPARLTVLLLLCSASMQAGESLVTSSETNLWHEFAMPEYGLRFKYPTEAVVLQGPDGINGNCWADGLKRQPYSIRMAPEFTDASLVGVFYHTQIRVLMITEDAAIDAWIYRRNGWTAKPTIPNLLPFEFNRDQHTLLNLFEMLYLGAPISRVAKQPEIKPAEINGLSGMRVSYRSIMSEATKSDLIEDITLVPVDGKRILLVHAGFSKVHGAEDFTRAQKNSRRDFEYISN